MSSPSCTCPNLLSSPSSIGSDTHADPGFLSAALPLTARPGRPVMDFAHALEHGLPLGRSMPWIWSFMQRQAYSSVASSGAVRLAATLQLALAGATPVSEKGEFFF